ncbi:MAG: hypothetical protein BGO95_04705 [Micrococcales bacterium 73-13]|nr:MAG: hypothetical protein BGO95_04705 [Micrococcales bacterium 73-13]
MEHGRRWRARIAAVMAFALAGSLGLAVMPQQAAEAVPMPPAPMSGTVDLFGPNSTACNTTGATMNGAHDITYQNPNGPTNPCRFAIEWRTGAYAGVIPRRTLFWVYAEPGDYILMGSSELVPGAGMGASQADIVLWKPEPGLDPSNMEGVSNATLDAGVDWRCTNGSGTGSRSSSNQRGVLNTRAKEVLGGASADGSANTSGYTPCYYQVQPGEGGFYRVAFYGYSGANQDSDFSPTDALLIGDASTTFPRFTGGGATRAWDISVRSSATAGAGIPGRVFTYAIAGFAGSNQRPINIGYFINTLDGYRYRVQTRGVDPAGFVVYGNMEGFLDADGTPLQHNVFGTNYSLANLAGNTAVAPPDYPLSFEMLAAETKAGLGIPDPQLPILTGLDYEGEIVDNESFQGGGGTFYADAGTRGMIQIVIDHDVVNPTFDPLDPANSTIYQVIEAGGTDIPVHWDGKANDGTPFPSGVNYPVRATLRGGEYHAPLLDAESAVWGTPSIALENPPGGICPFTAAAVNDPVHPTNCTTAFYDDRGYVTSDDIQVGNIGDWVCGASYLGARPNNPADHAFDFVADPEHGFDSASTIRRYGTTGNDNLGAGNCLTAATQLGNNAGIDLWTFFPSEFLATTPSVTVVPLPPIGAFDNAKYVGNSSSVSGNVLTDDVPDFGEGIQVLPGFTVLTNTSPSGHGTLTINPDGSYSMTTNGSWNNGTYAVRYTIQDSHGQTATAVLTLSGRLAVANECWTTQGVAVTNSNCKDVNGVVQTCNVLGNDLYSGALTGLQLQTQSAVPTANDGTISITTAASGRGNCSWTPDGGAGATYIGIVTRNYRFQQSGGNSEYVPLTIYVTPPVAPDTATTPLGTPVSGNALTNDGSVSGWTRTAVLLTPPPVGSLTLAADGSWTYTPPAGMSGVFQARYAAVYTKSGTPSAGTVLTVPTTLTITVTPLAIADSATTPYDTPVSGNALLNDLGLNSSGGHVDIATDIHCTSGPTICAGFSMADGGNGDWTYDPPAGFSGLVTIDYRASGAGGDSPPATITIRVLPQAVDDTATFQMNTTKTGQVLGNDHGVGLTVTGTGAPSYSTPCPGCSLTIAPDGTYTFVPALGWVGQVSAVYTATDAAGSTTTATLTLTEAAEFAAVDDGPYLVPVDDVWYSSTGSPHPGGQAQLTWNDVYTPTILLSCQLATDFAGTAWGTAGQIYDAAGNDVGDIELIPGGALCDYRYRFAAGTPLGSYSAQYLLSDGVRSDTAFVTFYRGSVAVDDTATAWTGGATVSGGVMANDICQTGGTADVTWIGDWALAPNVAAGTLAPGAGAVTNDGSWSYTPNATYSGVITRSYSTNRSPCDDPVATLRITVIPVAAPDASSGLANQVQSGNAVANDHGRNAAGGQIDKVTAIDCQHPDAAVCAGFAMTDLGNGAWTYTPPTDWSGRLVVGYRASGAGGLSIPSTITIDVLPVAHDDSGTFLPNQPRYGNVLANDAGSGLSVTATGAPSFPGCVSGCSLTIGAGGGYAFTPGLDSNGEPWVGTATIQYTATDSIGNSDTATLTLTGSAGLNAVDDGPYLVTTATNGGIGTGNNNWKTSTSGGNHPTSEQYLTWNDTYAGTPTCQFATNSSYQADTTALTWGTAGQIYNTSGADAGDIELIAGGNPCDYRYRIANNTAGSYTAVYQLCDATGCDLAYVTIRIGTTAIDDAAETTTGGTTATIANVLSNDLCTSGGSASADWRNVYSPSGENWTATPNVTYGTIAPTNGNKNGSAGTPYTQVTYTPNSTFSGVLMRAYRTDRTTGCSNRIALARVLVHPVAVNDVAAPQVAWPTGGSQLVVSGNVLNGTNGTADMGRNSAGNQIDRAAYVTCLDADAAVCSWFRMQNANGTYTGTPVLTPGTAAYTGTTNTTIGNGVWDFRPPAGWSGILQVRYVAYGAGGWSQPAFLTITVVPVAHDNAATGVARAAAGPYTPVSGNLITDGAPDLGDALQVLTHDPALHGALTVLPSGAYSYTPDPSWSGVEEIDYEIVDADGQTASARLTITIAPVGVDDEAWTEPMTPVSGNVLDNDLGFILGVTGTITNPATLPCDPDFALAADGAWSCTPEPGFSGDIVVEYTGQDAIGQPYTATLTIHVARHLTILKRGETDEATWIPMDGSEWAIYADAGLTAEVTDHPIEPTGTGEFRVDGLPDGDYWLVETKALSGFALLAEPIAFTVSSAGAITIVGGDSGNVHVAIVGGAWRITVDDVPAFVLPEAGGPGSTPFLLGGGVLLLAALALALGPFALLRRRPRGRHAGPRA